TTLDDLGSQGSPPSHPELLDWLAVELRESGWNVKHAVQLMVTSATYRQTSSAPEAVRLRDPGHALLARQRRWRLDGELVRGNGLAVSARLPGKAGGRGVTPCRPPGCSSCLECPVGKYPPEKGPDQSRRGLYRYCQPTFPHPSGLRLGPPRRGECGAERPR